MERHHGRADKVSANHSEVLGSNFQHGMYENKFLDSDIFAPVPGAAV